jgi:nucleoside 2-deoxyribosyltransferase
MGSKRIQKMKKVYFACSIAGGRDHAHVYGDIVNYIKASGLHVLSELFSDKELRPEVGMNLDPAFVWQRDVDWVKEADLFIAEVTQPSLGVGYEIAIAEALGKPVLGLFYKNSGRRLSPMIVGNPNVAIFEYEDVIETKSAIADFIKKL